MTISRPPEGVSPETARALERVVREALDGLGEPLDVQFASWSGEDGRIQFVCRVEGPPADPFSLEPQWRWWSGLLDGPDDLRAALGAAVARRRPSTPADHEQVAARVALG